MSDPEHIATTRRWLQYALEDLQAARVLMQSTDSAPRHACWLAQQAAEKALKAILVFLQTEPPRTHNLDALRNRLPTDWQTKHEHPDMAELSGWAVEARYPEEWADATADDARGAVVQADAIVTSVHSDLVRHGFTG